MGVNSLFGGGIRMLFKRAGSRLAPAVVMLCLLESVTRTKYTHTFIVVGRQSVNQSAGRRAALHICNTPFSLSFQAATFVDFFFYLPSFAGSLRQLCDLESLQLGDAVERRSDDDVAATHDSVSRKDPEIKQEVDDDKVDLGQQETRVEDKCQTTRASDVEAEVGFEDRDVCDNELI